MDSNVEITDQSKIPNVNLPKPEVVTRITTSQPKISILSLTRVEKVLDTVKYFTNIQEIFESILKGFRAPTTNKMVGHQQYYIPTSKTGIPAVGRNFLVGSVGSGSKLINGAGGSLLSWTYTYDNATAYIKLSNQKFSIKADPAKMVQLTSSLATLKEKSLTDLTRMTRAAAQFTAADWLAFIFDYVLDTSYRNINTYTVAQWMYNKVSSASGLVYFINANDLRSYLQTNINTLPIPADTVILDMEPGLPDATLGKFILLHDRIFVDWNNSFTPNSTYNGVPAYSVNAVAVNPGDVDVARILSRTYSVEDLDWALFVNALPLRVTNTQASEGVEMELNTYKNSIQDQVINFWFRGSTSLAGLPDDPNNANNAYQHFVFAFRVAKTVFTQRAWLDLSQYGGTTSAQTCGKDMDYYSAMQEVSGCWTPLSNATGMFNCTWIPYEFWIANGAKLAIDEAQLTISDGPVPVNKVFRFPASQSPFSVSEFNGTYMYKVVDYYQPQTVTSVLTVWVYNDFNPWVPTTLPRYSSTCEGDQANGGTKGRMSIPFDLDQQIRWYPKCITAPNKNLVSKVDSGFD